MAVRRNARNEPTRRTLELLEANGWVADIAERRQGRISYDLFGCIDIVAVNPALQVTLFVQVTSETNMASRVSKVCCEPRVRKLLAAGCRVEVWGWRAERNQPRIVRVDEGDLVA